MWAVAHNRTLKFLHNKILYLHTFAYEIVTIGKLEKVFKKKHSCGFIFTKLCYTLILNVYFPLNEIIQE